MQFLFLFGSETDFLHIVADATHAERIGAHLIDPAFHISDDIMRVWRGLADSEVIRHFKPANLIPGEKTEFTLLLARHDTAKVGHAQNFTHVSIAGQDARQGLSLSNIRPPAQ